MTVCPLKCFFGHRCFVQLNSKLKKVAQMYEEEVIFRNGYLNCFGRFNPGDLDL